MDQISNSDHSVLVHLDSLHQEVELRGGERLPAGVGRDEVLDVGHRHQALPVNIEDRQALVELVWRRLVLALTDPHHLLKLAQSQASSFKVLGDVHNLERIMLGSFTLVGDRNIPQTGGDSPPDISLHLQPSPWEDDQTGHRNP